MNYINIIVFVLLIIAITYVILHYTVFLKKDFHRKVVGNIIFLKVLSGVIFAWFFLMWFFYVIIGCRFGHFEMVQQEFSGHSGDGDFSSTYYLSNLFFGDLPTMIILLSSALFFFNKTRKMAKIPLYIGIWIGFVSLIMWSFGVYTSNISSSPANPDSFGNTMWYIFCRFNGFYLKIFALAVFGFFVIANSTRFIIKSEFNMEEVDSTKTILKYFVTKTDSFKMIVFFVLFILYDIVMGYIVNAAMHNSYPMWINGLFKDEYGGDSGGSLYFINVKFNIYPLNVFLLYLVGTSITISIILLFNRINKIIKYPFEEEFFDI